MPFSYSKQCTNLALTNQTHTHAQKPPNLSKTKAGPIPQHANQYTQSIYSTQHYTRP